jgi:hypothetical protein
MGTFQAPGAEVTERNQELPNAVFPLYPAFSHFLGLIYSNIHVN